MRKEVCSWKFRKFAKVLLVALFIILLSYFVSAQTQLFFEDWEAGNFNNWNNTGWAIATDRAIGTNSAKCATAVVCDMNLTTSLDTSSASEINITLQINDDDGDLGDYLLYFNDSLGNWDQVADLNPASEDVWLNFSFTTIDSQYFHTGFNIIFSATPDTGGGANSENLWIDNINVSYTPQQPQQNLSVNLSQTFNLNLQTQRTAKINKITTDSLTINSLVKTTSGKLKEVFQVIDITDVVSRLLKGFRNSFQLIDINDAVIKVFNIIRITFHPLNINNAVSTAKGALREVFQIIDINDNIARLFKGFRNFAQLITLNHAVSSVIPGKVLVDIVQVIDINESLTRTFTGFRNFFQFIDINESIKSAFGVLRNIAQTIDINDAITRLFTSVRKLSQQLTANAITGRFAFISKNIPQNINTFTSISITKFRIFFVNVYQTFNVNIATKRTAFFFRNLFDRVINNILCAVNGENCVPAPIPSPSPEVPPSAGGSEKGGILPKFSIDREEIIIKVRPGKISQYSFIVSNEKDGKFNFIVNLSELKEYIIFPKEFTLDSFEKKNVTLIINAPDKTGVYTSTLTIQVFGTKKEIPIILIVESIEKLFDVELEIPQRYKEISAGDDITFKVNIFNLGDVEADDVTLSYIIKDTNNNIILQDSRVFAIEKQASFLKDIHIPDYIKSGKYVLTAEVKYLDTVTSSSSIITVKEKSKALFLISDISKIIILLLVLISIFHLIYSHRFGKKLGSRILKGFIGFPSIAKIISNKTINIPKKIIKEIWTLTLISFKRNFPNRIFQITDRKLADGSHLILIIDNYSLYCLDADIFKKVKTHNVTRLLERAISMHGKPVEILLTGSDPEFGIHYDNNFDKWCKRFGIRHIRDSTYASKKIANIQESIINELPLCNNDLDTARKRYNEKKNPNLNGLRPRDIYFEYKSYKKASRYSYAFKKFFRFLSYLAVYLIYKIIDLGIHLYYRIKPALIHITSFIINSFRSIYNKIISLKLKEFIIKMLQSTKNIIIGLAYYIARFFRFALSNIRLTISHILQKITIISGNSYVKISSLPFKYYMENLLNFVKNANSRIKEYVTKSLSFLKYIALKLIQLISYFINHSVVFFSSAYIGQKNVEKNKISGEQSI
ncbi:hypothetical protein HYV49_06105 [Candidatus Pacearchaeota archaeon]|nr:hypothetical protein [Candidatus Pacearchaeota archaeon]